MCDWQVHYTRFECVSQKISKSAKQTLLGCCFLIAAMTLVGCNHSKNLVSVVDVPSENELKQKVTKLTASKNNDEVVEVLEKLVRYYPNSQQYKSNTIALAKAHYRNRDYQQAKEVASSYISRFGEDKHVYEVALLWLQSIHKLVKPSWLGARFQLPGDSVSAGLLEEGVQVADQVLGLRKNANSKQFAHFKTVFSEKLAHHHFDIAQFYARKGAYLASQQRIQDCLRFTKNNQLISKAQALLESNAKRLGV